MRSINGRDIFDMYLWICGGVQKHSRRKSFANPHGQGFAISYDVRSGPDLQTAIQENAFKNQCLGFA